MMTTNSQPALQDDRGESATQGSGAVVNDDGSQVNDDVSCSGSKIVDEAQATVDPQNTGDATQANSSAQAALNKRCHKKQPRSTVDMSRYAYYGYVQDHRLLSWMTSLPVSPVPKSYSWSNEATMFFILALCEARRIGLITPVRLYPSNKQGRVAIWEYIRQRFCQSGLYALVLNLTDAVLEAKYKAEQDATFKPYKKLVRQQYDGRGFDMDVAGQFTAPDELWDHHFSIKGNSKDIWLRQRGMPLWAQYEEAYGEDVATGELALVAKEQQRASFIKYTQNMNYVNPAVGSQHNVVQPREQEVTPSSFTQQQPNAGPSRPVEATPIPAEMPPVESTPPQSTPAEPTSEVTIPTKRRREAGSSISDVHSQMVETLQKSNSTIDMLASMLGRQHEQRLKAYSAVRRLRLGRDVETAAKKALENDFNIVDVLELESEQDENGLREWCLELVNAR